LFISPLRGPSFSITVPVNRLGHVDGEMFDRLHTQPSNLVTIPAACHQFEAFAAHHLNENGKL